MAGKGNPENPWVWAKGGIALSPASTVKPPAKGDITGESPSAKDPDQLQGTLTWSGVTAALTVAAAPAPKQPQGGITTDAWIAPGKTVSPLTFSLGGVPIAVGVIVTPQPGKGDIMLTYEGADGQKQTINGEITWALGGAALAPTAVTRNAGKGDITGDYGPNELWKEIATWASGNVPLAPGQLSQSGPKGDFPDPNTWQDVILYRTSQLYPLLVIEHFQDGGVPPNSPYVPIKENWTDGGFILGTGQLYLGLVTYSNYKIENFTDGGIFTSGSLTVPTPPHVYSNWPAEHFQDACVVPSGTLYLGLITYSNWPAEHFQDAGIFTGGTLT